MTTQTLDLNNIERKIFWTLASLLGISIGFYLYSVASLTVALIDTSSMNATAHDLASKTATIEQEYLERSNSITLAYAQTLGFKEVSAKFANVNLPSSPADSGIKLSMAQ